MALPSNPSWRDKVTALYTDIELQLSELKRDLADFEWRLKGTYNMDNLPTTKLTRRLANGSCESLDSFNTACENTSEKSRTVSDTDQESFISAFGSVSKLNEDPVPDEPHHDCNDQETAPAVSQPLVIEVNRGCQDQVPATPMHTKYQPWITKYCSEQWPKDDCVEAIANSPRLQGKKSILVVKENRPSSMKSKHVTFSEDISALSIRAYEISRGKHAFVIRARAKVKRAFSCTARQVVEDLKCLCKKMKIVHRTDKGSMCATEGQIANTNWPPIFSQPLQIQRFSPKVQQHQIFIDSDVIVHQAPLLQVHCTQEMKAKTPNFLIAPGTNEAVPSSPSSTSTTSTSDSQTTLMSLTVTMAVMDAKLQQPISPTGVFFKLVCPKSSVIETDIDSGTQFQFPVYSETDVDTLSRTSGSASPLTPSPDRVMNTSLQETLEGGSIADYLASRAQSTPELRIAASLAKLNLPDWFRKSSCTPSVSTTSLSICRDDSSSLLPTSQEHCRNRPVIITTRPSPLSFVTCREMCSTTFGRFARSRSGVQVGTYVQPLATAF